MGDETVPPPHSVSMFVLEALSGEGGTEWSLPVSIIRWGRVPPQNSRTEGAAPSAVSSDLTQSARLLGLLVSKVQVWFSKT